VKTRGLAAEFFRKLKFQELLGYQSSCVFRIASYPSEALLIVVAQ
jgi:hypothetical protein